MSIHAETHLRRKSKYLNDIFKISLFSSPNTSDFLRWFYNV